MWVDLLHRDHLFSVIIDERFSRRRAGSANVIKLEMETGRVLHMYNMMNPNMLWKVKTDGIFPDELRYSKRSNTA